MCEDINAMRAVVKRLERDIHCLQDKNNNLILKLNQLEVEIAKIQSSLEYINQLKQLKQKHTSYEIKQVDYTKIIQALIGGIIALIGYFMGRGF